MRLRKRATILPTLEACVFVFFSNRLGCLGSILVSLILTGILYLLFGG